MKVRTADQWHELIRARRASGISIDQFCKANQISSSSFYTWQSIVGGRTSKAPRPVATKAVRPLPEFIAVDVTTKSAEPKVSSHHLVIMTSYGAKLEIPL